MRRSGKKPDSRPARRTGRRFWRILRRGVLLPAMLMLLAYLTIPWWLPTNWLRGQIIDQLQRDTGLPVSLAGLEASWRDGIVLRDLRIYQADEFGPGEFLRVEQISCPLTPIRTLLFRQLGPVKLTDARLWIVRSEAGELNTERLKLPPPALHVKEITCDDARIYLINRLSRHTAEIPLNAFTMRFESTGVVRVALSGHGEYQSDEDGDARELGNFAVTANVLDPYAPGASSPARQGGTLQLSWQTVDLASLTAGDWQSLRNLGLRGLAGHCGGSLELELDPNGRMSWQFSGRMSDLRLDLAQAPRGVRLTWADVELAGRFDAASQHIIFDRAWLSLPGLELEASGEVRPLDGNYLSVNIRHARVQPHRLRDAAPDILETLLDPAWQIAGELSLAGQFEWSDSYCKLAVAVDAGGLAARAPWLTRDPRPDGRLTFQARTEYRRDLDRLRIQQFQLDLDSSTLTMVGQADELYAIWHRHRGLAEACLDWSSNLLLRTADIEQLLDRVPALARTVGPVRLAGPAEFNVVLQPVDAPAELNAPRIVAARQVVARLLLPAEATLLVPDARSGLAIVSKPAGEPVSIGLDACFDAASPTLKSAAITCQLGADAPAMLVIDTVSARLLSSYRLADQPGEQLIPAIDGLVLDGKLLARNIERFLAISPLLANHLARQDIEVSGGCAGELSLRLGRDAVRGRLALDLEAMGLRLFRPTLLRKQPGEPLHLQANVSAYPVAGGRHYGESVKLAGLGVRLAGTREIDYLDGLASEQRSVSVQIDDAAAMQRHCPLIAERLAEAGVTLRGTAEGQFHWRLGDADVEHVFDVAIDATDLAVVAGRDTGPGLAGQAAPTILERLFDKPAGLPLRLGVRIATNLPEGPVQPRIGVQRGRLEIGQSRLHLAGTCELLAVWWDAEFAVAKALRPIGLTLGGYTATPPPIDMVDLTLHGQIAAEPAVLAILPEVARLAERTGLSGEATFSARLTGGWERLQIEGWLDGGGLAIAWPGTLVKPAGTPGQIELKLLASPWLQILHIDRLFARLDDITIDAAGRVSRRAGGLLPRGYDVKIGIDAGDIGQLARLAPWLLSDERLLAGPLSGRLAARAHLFADDAIAEAPPDRPRLLESWLELDNIAATVAGAPVSASGRVELSQRSMAVPRMQMRIADSRFAVVGRIEEPFARPRGWVDLVGTTLDVDQLAELWTRLQDVQLLDGPQPPAGRPPECLPMPSDSVLRPPPDDAADQIIDLLARCDIAGRVHFVDLSVTDAKNQAHYKLAEFRSRFTIDRGQVNLPFTTAMEGGLLSGRVHSDLNVADPMLHIEYEARKLLATAAVQPIIEAFFPGMTVTGYVTMSESSHSRLLAEPDEPNWSVGTGELVFENGVLVGQGGPDWMARIFPGLKLTRYHFTRMHNWFTLTADGKAHHHMIFDGRDYDIYMTGWTDRATGRAEYTVGVDLLASLDSKTWSVDLRQGKIPLMHVTGWIEDRKMRDQTSTMVLLPEVLWQVLIRDNIVYRAVIDQARRRGAAEP